MHCPIQSIFIPYPCDILVNKDTPHYKLMVLLEQELPEASRRDKIDELGKFKTNEHVESVMYSCSSSIDLNARQPTDFVSIMAVTRTPVNAFTRHYFLYLMDV